MSSETTQQFFDAYDKEMNALKEGKPFILSLDDDVDMDEVLVTGGPITIYDVRVEYMEEEEENCGLSPTVKMNALKDNAPWTVRSVIDAMAKHHHFIDMDKVDSHIFLESVGVDSDNPRMILVDFGS